MHGLRQGVQAVAVWLERGASAALAGMMLITVADVVLRTLNADWRISGVVEVVVVLFSFSVFFAIAGSFVLRHNIVVNVIDALVSRPIARFLAVTSSIATVIYLSMLIVQGFVNAHESMKYDDQTMYLALPLVLFWVPILIGFVVAAIGELVLLASGRGGADEVGGDHH